MSIDYGRRTFRMLAGLGAVIVVAVALISVWVPAMAGSKIKPRDQMVFTHDNRQYLISLNGGAARQLNLAFTHTKARRSARVKIPTVFTYEWAPDGRYLLSQMSGANQAIGLWSAAGRLLRNLTRRSNANAPLGWATDRDEIVYLTQGSPRHFVCKKRHCPPVTWTVVNSLTAAGKSSQVWPRKRLPTSTTGGFNVGALSVRQFDPAHALLGAELNDNAPTVTWSANRNIVVYPDLYGGSVLQPWRVLDIRTGGHWLLPFGFTSARTARGKVESTMPFGSSVVLSRRGMLAGTVDGIVAIRGLGPRARLHRIGLGYAPAWSRDGKWLFYVASKHVGSLEFQIRIKTFAITTCHTIHARHCGALHHPFRRVWSWIPVHSAVNDVSVYRVNASGRDHQLLFSQTAYGVADLNPLPDNSGLVFSEIPTDLGLWQHRDNHGRVSPTQMRVLKPYTSIEKWTFGSQPTTIVVHGHLPAVQP